MSLSINQSWCAIDSFKRIYVKSFWEMTKELECAWDKSGFIDIYQKIDHTNRHQMWRYSAKNSGVLDAFSKEIENFLSS